MSPPKLYMYYPTTVYCIITPSLSKWSPPLRGSMLSYLGHPIAAARSLGPNLLGFSLVDKWRPTRSLGWWNGATWCNILDTFGSPKEKISSKNSKDFKRLTDHQRSIPGRRQIKTWIPDPVAVWSFLLCFLETKNQRGSKFHLSGKH